MVGSADNNVFVTPANNVATNALSARAISRAPTIMTVVHRRLLRINTRVKAMTGKAECEASSAKL